MPPTPVPSESEANGTLTVLAMTATCMMVIGFNSTAVATVLPNLKAEFDMAPSQVQWIMAIYTVTGATLVTILSRLGDVLGKMGVFLFGMIVFALGSALVMMSQDALMLLSGRAVQGAGAASLFGTSLSVLTAATPEKKRAGVVGVWGAIVGLAIGIGPILGGAFANYLSWRAIFALDLFLLAIAFLIGLRVSKKKFVPDTRMAGAKLDVPGAIALVFFLGPLSFALSNGEANGWTSTWTVAPMIVSLLAVVALIVAMRKNDDPLIELRYFHHPRYVMAALGMFVTGFALFCFFVFFNVFVQSPDTFGYDAIHAGLAVLPLSLSMFLVSITAPRILAPYNFHWPIVLSMAAISIGFFLLSTTNNTTNYSEIWWKLAIVGIGMGMCFSLLPRLGLRLLPDEHAGQGSGVINTFLYFGGTLGSVLGGVASGATTRNGLSEVIAALPSGSEESDDLARALTHGAPSEIEALLSKLDPQTSSTLATALRDLRDNAFDSAMLVCSAGAVLGLLLALWLLRGPVPPVQDALRFTQTGR